MQDDSIGFRKIYLDFFAAFSELNSGKLYIIEFLKVCSLLMYITG